MRPTDAFAVKSRDIGSGKMRTGIMTTWTNKIREDCWPVGCISRPLDYRAEQCSTIGNGILHHNVHTSGDYEKRLIFPPSAVPLHILEGPPLFFQKIDGMLILELLAGLKQNHPDKNRLRRSFWLLSQAPVSSDLFLIIAKTPLPLSFFFAHSVQASRCPPSIVSSAMHQSAPPSLTYRLK